MNNVFLGLLLVNLVKMKPIWILPVFTYLCFAKSQTPCLTTDGKRGECKNILECPTIRKIANKPSLTLEETYILKRLACGFEDNIPKVCCASGEDTCFTPEGHRGRCVSVFECDHIAKRLQSPKVTVEDKAYVNSIRCPSPEGFHVCCGPPPTGRCQPSTGPPDPSTQCCGLDGSGGNKLSGGNATSIDQYPWLAIIEYKRKNEIKLMCGGTLISARYVLTAAHCVKNTVSTAGEPANVRLGEYDVSKPGRDCVPIAGGAPGELDCNDEPVVIPIELVICHPNFGNDPLRRHDIALLRLQKLAPYTDFIRPICLPTSDVTANLRPSVRLYAAGWGANNESHSGSDVKLHVDLPYKSIQACQSAYNVSRRRVTLWGGQICAGGERGRDTCRGDSGGPLMHFSTNTLVYQLVGIVSFGARPCGQEDIPGVYTKVFQYLSWIRSNFQP